MINEIHQHIKEHIEDVGLDLKIKYGEKILPIIEKSTLLISYDYLLNDDSEYSFNNDLFYEKKSEYYKDKTDYQIYFEKIKKICSTKFDEISKDTFNFKIVSLSKNLKKVLENNYNIEGLTPEQIPTFVEIKLYTNKNSNRAPRIFGFIGNANVLYILFYDPFHKIFDATSKSNTKYF